MSVNLDNPKTYHQYDQSEAYQNLNKFPRHFENGCNDATNTVLQKHPSVYTDLNIITSGLDQHLASFSKSLTPFFLKVPLTISTASRLPPHLNPNSLLLHLYTDRSNPEIKSTDLEAEAKKTESIHLENQSLGYTLGYLFGLLARFDTSQNKAHDFNKIFSVVEETVNKLQKDITRKSNPAKQIAERHSQKAVLFFSAGHLTGVSEFASGQVIRQSKTFSQHYIFPEVKHFAENLFTYPAKVLSEYQVMLINSDLYPNNTKNEIQDFKHLLSQKRINFTEIKPDRQEWFEQIVETVVFLSYFSYYLSITNKVTI